MKEPTQESRRIIHVDMDAFYASVEQLDNPAIRGQPVVVAWKGQRSVVCAASYEARAFGIRSAMPAIRAERLCSHAVFVPPNFTRYKEVSSHVRDIFRRYTDHIEPLSLDEAYLDVTKVCATTTATDIARSIRLAIHSELNLTASAGVSYNKFLAKIASDWRKPNGLFVITPERSERFLASLPVGRLPGVGKVTEARLLDLGVTNVLELREIDLAILEENFGRWGKRLFDLARGIDNSQVVSERSSSQISTEDTFPTDLTLDEIRPHIERLSASTWSAYEREASKYAHISARTASIKLKTSDFQILTRSQTYSSPLLALSDLVQACGTLLSRIELPPDQRFRLLGIGLAGLSRDEVRQNSLFNGSGFEDHL